MSCEVKPGAEVAGGEGLDLPSPPPGVSNVRLRQELIPGTAWTTHLASPGSWPRARPSGHLSWRSGPLAPQTPSAPAQIRALGSLILRLRTERSPEFSLLTEEAGWGEGLGSGWGAEETWFSWLQHLFAAESWASCSQPLSSSINGLSENTSPAYFTGAGGSQD